MYISRYTKVEQLLILEEEFNNLNCSILFEFYYEYTRNWFCLYRDKEYDLYDYTSVIQYTFYWGGSLLGLDFWEEKHRKYVQI